MSPFWFASNELLTEVWHAEINVVTQLLAEYPDLPDLFDVPEATVPQRTACFALLAHRKVIEIIDETLIGRYEKPSLDDVESNTIRRTHNLVVADAPLWALEVQQVVDRLPAHIYASLPEPLRTGAFGFNQDDAQQMQAIQSARNALSSIVEIQALTKRVFDQQLQRLARRWSASVIQVRGPNKRKGWEQREKLYEAIRRALSANPSLQGIELCAELDKRHAPPLYDWEESGEWREGLTWKEAWINPRLRSRIRRVRQEAQKAR